MLPSDPAALDEPPLQGLKLSGRDLSSLLLHTTLTPGRAKNDDVVNMPARGSCLAMLHHRTRHHCILDLASLAAGNTNNQLAVAIYSEGGMCQVAGRRKIGQSSYCQALGMQLGFMHLVANNGFQQLQPV